MARVNWSHFCDGEIHALTVDEVQDLFGNDIHQFRNRLTVHCRRKGWAYTSRVDGDNFRFCISTDGNVRDLGQTASNHSNCAHPPTNYARKLCRDSRDSVAGKEKQRLKMERAQQRRAKARPEQKIRATEEKLADEISLAMTEEWLTQVEMHCTAAEEEVGVFDPMDGIRERQAIRRKESRERVYAKWGPPTERWDPAKHRGGPTVYALAHFIHIRMKNDRKHKGWYRFTYEWVKSHYPHLLANYRDLVEDSLELLVIQGKIELLDIPVKVAVSGV